MKNTLNEISKDLLIIITIIGLITITYKEYRRQNEELCQTLFETVSKQLDKQEIKILDEWTNNASTFREMERREDIKKEIEKELKI